MERYCLIAVLNEVNRAAADIFHFFFFELFERIFRIDRTRFGHLLTSFPSLTVRHLFGS